MIHSKVGMFRQQTGWPTFFWRNSPNIQKFVPKYPKSSSKIPQKYSKFSYLKNAFPYDRTDTETPLPIY